MGSCNQDVPPTSCRRASYVGALKIKRIKIKGQSIWFDPSLLSQIVLQTFDPDHHRREGNLTGSASGRNTAHFLRLEGHDLVLRAYQRGGLMGKINRSLYLRLGAERSRVFREYSLLEWMHEQGLAVPRPVAARYVPAGAFYRADLITLRIPQAKPLADVLQESELPPDVWSGIGQAIGRMHALGVDHSDLNCRNILLDAQMQAWLIDFDKCCRRAKGAWQDHNLSRLRRSLDKESRKHPALFWLDSDWSSLCAGYSATRA